MSIIFIENRSLLKHYFIPIFIVATSLFIFLSSCDKKEKIRQQTLIIQIDSLLYQSESSIFKDYGTSVKYAQKALQLSKLSDYEEGTITANRNLALANNQKGFHHLAFKQIDTAISLASNIKNEELLALSKQTKGYIYFTISKFDSAYLWYMSSLPFFENSEDKHELSNLYSKIGRVYYNKSEFDHAYIYYQKALTITKEFGDEKAIARELNNIGSVYEFQNKKTEALIYFHEALKLNLKSNRKEWIAINYHNIAKIFSDDKEYDSANIYFVKALKIDQELGNNSYIAEDLFSWGIHYQKFKEHHLAIKYFKEAEILCKETNNLSTLRRIYDALSSSQSIINNYKEALMNYKAYHSLTDSLFNSKSSRRIIEMEMQHKYDLEKSTQSIKQQRSLIILLSTIGGLLFLAFIMTSLYARSKVKEKNSILKGEKLQDKLYENEALLTTNVMRLSEKNKTLDLILQDLKSFSLNLRKRDQEHLDKITLNIRQNMNENIWNEFDIRFKNVYGDFYDKLSKIHPDLSPNETRLCAFLKLNMSTKEIARITHQSPKGINVARSRLRKKLNLTHSEKNIFEYLSEI